MGRAADGASTALYVPEHQPPVTGAVIGRDGVLWVRREHENGPAVTWDVLSGDGVRIMSMRLPREFSALRGERDAIWGVERDANDLPRIVRYRTRDGGRLFRLGTSGTS